MGEGGEVHRGCGCEQRVEALVHRRGMLVWPLPSRGVSAMSEVRRNE